MSREALYSILGESPTKEVPNKKEPILRIRTNLKLRGKVLWMFWCRGHRKVTTDPDFLLAERGWSELAGIFAVFYIKDIQDDGRAAAWIKQEIKEGKLKQKLPGGLARTSQQMASHLQFRKRPRTLTSTNNYCVTVELVSGTIE